MPRILCSKVVIVNFFNIALGVLTVREPETCTQGTFGSEVISALVIHFGRARHVGTACRFLSAEDRAC